MKQFEQAPEGKDPVLWEIARKRAGFKRHLVAYIIVNGFLWAIWFFGNRHLAELNHLPARYPWPIWPTLGWGIGLAFDYANAYMFPRANSVEKEYEKIKNEQNRK